MTQSSQEERVEDDADVLRERDCKVLEEEEKRRSETLNKSQGRALMA